MGGAQYLPKGLKLPNPIPSYVTNGINGTGPDIGKSYVPREGRLVVEWVQAFHPSALQWRKVRLGPLPNVREKAIYSVLRRYADLIFIEDRTVFIVEAKIRPEPGALGQLDLYAQLFPKTPEFSEFSTYPIKTILLTTTLDKEVKKLAAEYGTEYVVFAPDWAKEYVQSIILRQG